MEANNTMFEYLKWRGDLTFDADPFNEVDNLILSQLAYVDYDGIVSDTRENPVPIGEVCSKYWEMHTETEIKKRESFVKLSPFLLKPVAESRRFGKMLVCGYVNHLSKSTESQMSAVQFELEDGTTYVAFRGTDETLIGWKEDFNLSYMSRTEGQRLAVEYMKKHFHDTTLKLRVGGHSKGGNFAVFASAFSGASVREQIKTVFSNDAPGFREEITSKPEYKQIQELTVNIIPQDSIIGRLLSAGRAARVVQSSRKGIMQHDAMSWQIFRNRFALTERSNDSLMLEKVLSGWLENVDDDSRKVFVDQLFSILQTMGADTVKDMKEIGLRDLSEAMQAIRGLSREQQDEMAEVVKELLRSGERTFYDEMEQREGIIPDVFKKLQDLRERVNEARATAESVKLGVQAGARAAREKASEAAAEASPEEKNEQDAAQPSDEAIKNAKDALEEGIEIKGSEADDGNGEDPQ